MLQREISCKLQNGIHTNFEHDGWEIIFNIVLIWHQFGVSHGRVRQVLEADKDIDIPGFCTAR